MNVSAVKRDQPGLVEQVYQTKPFWGWKRALEDAGIDYSSIRIELSGHIECRICGRQMGAMSSHLRAVHRLSTNRYLLRYPDAEVLPETGRALYFAESQLHIEGLPHWEPVWTPEYVLDRICELNRRGNRLNGGSVARQEPCLYRYAKRFFGSWEDAVERIGVWRGVRLRKPKREWTHDAVTKALRWRSYTCKPLNWTATRSSDQSLAYAARRLFESYDRALLAAGMDPSKHRKQNGCTVHHLGREKHQAVV